MSHRSHFLNVKAFALSLGLLWATGLFFISIIALFTDTYLHQLVNLLTSWYIGYSLDPFGIVIGVIWAFLDAGLGGLVFAWLYNKFSTFACCQSYCGCKNTNHTNCCDSLSNDELSPMEDKLTKK